MYKPSRIKDSLRVKRIENSSNTTYEVLADIIDEGRSIQMSTRHERELVDRLN